MIITVKVISASSVNLIRSVERTFFCFRRVYFALCRHLFDNLLKSNIC